MATPLREFYSDKYIHHISYELANIYPHLKSNDFSQAVLQAPWEELSLKARMSWLTDKLYELLPEDYAEAIFILKKLLPQISIKEFLYSDMLTMFIPNYVCRYGLKDWDISMEALAYFTSHGTSSEFAIRPFIAANQEKTFLAIDQWAHDSNPHIRRFASEGCRPRLPWSQQLPALIADPTPIIPILEKLRSDDQLYVKKSVANNLNDISKDHPEQVITLAKNWINQNPHTDWILKHACRGLLKKSNPVTLNLFGASNVNIDQPTLTLQNDQILFHDYVVFEFSAVIAKPLPEVIRIEYAIDFMKANQTTSRKRFKIQEGTPKSLQISVQKKHRFTNYTTRKHYPGQHHLTIFVNGQEIITKPFTLIIN